MMRKRQVPRDEPLEAKETSGVSLNPSGAFPPAALPASVGVVGDQPAAGPQTLRTSLISAILPYVSIARPDHWIKNVFMVAGVILAIFYHPDLIGALSLQRVLWAIAATCVIVSCNYVINEILDAPTDRSHPVKRERPIPSGLVRPALAYAEWIVLGMVGLTMASVLGPAFFASALLLLIMGMIYNIPPIRSKDWPYVDVLSESVNNPIRLLLGWFAVSATEFPPISMLIAYWMIGAFLMASKRFCEYRSIGDPVRAGQYRRSFRYYDEQKLLISMVFYVTNFALFLGVFIVRYHLELILSFPLIAGFVSHYLGLAFKHNSGAQNPERLYKERGLMVYMFLCIVVFFGLMFVNIPALYNLFNVKQSPISPLWRI
jgi:decaprenyl-phosphate phosphoribosyltransferase